MISLRTFCFRSLAGGAFLALAPSSLTRPASAVVFSRQSDGRDFEGFSQVVGSVFHVDGGQSGPLSLRLIRAERRTTPPRSNPKAPDAGFEKFSLIFEGRPDLALPQETYAFQHPGLGRFELFIVPVGSLNPKVQKYQAVFNRPRPV